MSAIGPILLVLVVALPLAMALVAPFLDRPLKLLAWAAAPGLVVALAVAVGQGGPGQGVDVPIVVLGLSLAVDRAGVIFLGSGALLWVLAGVHACSYMAGTAGAGAFAAFWLVTLAGTLGTFIAADIVTFYMSFSLMSLASYGLVVHDRKAAAWRAGRVYIVLAMIGETALLGAFIVAAAAADSLAIADVQAALASSPWRDWALAGFVVGFGMKAGLVPLHVWLPLAHPQAPTPASAVLSGVIVKAGIIGLMRFMPMEEGAWSDILVVLGLVTTFYGALAGLAQEDVKAILAYSTLSQMGLVVTVIGAALASPDAAPAYDAISLYAAQHGLAKGALFLGIGVVAASGETALRRVMPAMALMALSIAGLPLTGGALGKLALKDPLGDGTVSTLVTLSALTTALLMLRFVFLLARGARRADVSPPAGLVLPWAATAVAALVLPWILFPALAGHAPAYAVTLGNLWGGLWPILVALVAAGLALRLRLAAPNLPQGDIVVLTEAFAGAMRSAYGAWDRAARNLSLPRFRSAAPARVVGFLEQRAEQWSVVGPVVLILVLIGAALL